MASPVRGPCAPATIAAPSGPAARAALAGRPALGKPRFSEVLGEAGGRAGSVEAAGPLRQPAPARAAPAGAPTDSPLRAALRSVTEVERRLDQTIRGAMRGQALSAGQMIALQADVFRYSQQVEVLSRLADRAAGTVRQVLGTQV